MKDMEFDNKAEIDLLYDHLNIKANLLYAFIISYADYIFESRDYGTGEKFGMLVVHILTQIDDNPGITASELAKFWNRTKGAISQYVKILEQKDLIRREKDESNARIIHLYTTPKGAQLALKHKIFDINNLMRMNTGLLNECTPGEVDTFFKVLQVYQKLL